jgi:hypothetical protein
MRGPLGSSLRGKLNKNCALVPKSLLKFDKFFVEWGMSRAIHVKFYAKIHATPPIPEGFTHSFKHFFCLCRLFLHFLDLLPFEATEGQHLRCGA